MSLFFILDKKINKAVLLQSGKLTEHRMPASVHCL